MLYWGEFILCFFLSKPLTHLQILTSPASVKQLRDAKTLRQPLGLDAKCLWTYVLTEMVHDRRDVLLQLLEVAWFFRAWVYQEAVTSPNVHVVWGKTMLPFELATDRVASAYTIAKGLK